MVLTWCHTPLVDFEERWKIVCALQTFRPVSVACQDIKEIEDRGDLVPWAQAICRWAPRLGRVTCTVDWEEMHGELCIHLVIPAGGTDYYHTLILVQREWQWERRFIWDGVFSFCLHLFKVTLRIWFILMTSTSIFVMHHFCLGLFKHGDNSLGKAELFQQPPLQCEITWLAEQSPEHNPFWVELDWGLWGRHYRHHQWPASLMLLWLNRSNSLQPGSEFWGEKELVQREIQQSITGGKFRCPYLCKCDFISVPCFVISHRCVWQMVLSHYFLFMRSCDSTPVATPRFLYTDQPQH